MTFERRECPLGVHGQERNLATEPSLWPAQSHVQQFAQVRWLKFENRQFVYPPQSQAER